MITPGYSPTATERVLPRMALDFTTASLDSRVTVTRALNTATRINSSGYVEIVNAGLPRFDFSPTSLGTCRGLLIEESRINICQYSSDFSNAVWQKTSISLTPNATTAPDGTLTAYKIEATAPASVIQSITATSTSHVYTIFAKQGSAANQGARFLLRNNTTATNLLGVLVDYSNGSFIYTVGSSGATVEPYRDGWWRITLVVTSGITAGNDILVYVGFTGGGAAGHFLYAWGADFQAGAFPTSHIPSTTATTRNADVVSMTGTNFSDWYNATEGTVQAEASTFDVSSTRCMLGISDGTASNLTELRLVALAGTANSRFLVLASGSVVCNLTSSGATAANTTYRLIGAYKENSFSAARDGVSIGSDLSGATPTVNRMNIGASATGSSLLNGHIRKILYYPQRLINAELLAFSK